MDNAHASPGLAPSEATVDFISRAGSFGVPGGWTAVTPNPALAPHFGCTSDAHDRPALWAAGNGREECYGYLRHPVRLEARKTYRLRVELEPEGLADVNRHLVHGIFPLTGGGYNEGIFQYRCEDGRVIGEAVFRGPEVETDAEVRLTFRFSAAGRVLWRSVTLAEAEPIAPRRVRIACAWGAGNLEHWTQWLDAAGARKVDVALVPEMFDGRTPAEAQGLDGPAPRLLAEKAAQWGMHTCGSFYERREDVVFNTATLFDRSGRLVGQYDKNQLYDPELDQGVTPGRGFPVFRTDFGVVGIIICYDSWFSEPVRLLAYKGAELVLFPNAGYDAELMPARAADNTIWLATSSLNCPAAVWDSTGARAGEHAVDATRFGPSSIVGYERDDDHRMIVATVDLSRPASPHWWGGPLLSAPGGRRVRQTLIQPIEDEIAQEARRWCEPAGESA